MKRSLKVILSALAALIVPALGWSAEPWAAWTDFTGLTGSKAPDISSTQNSINGGSFTFNLGSGVVQADGSIVTTGGSGAAPYIDFNQVIDVGYGANHITVVMTVEVPGTLSAVKPLWTVGNGSTGVGLTVKELADDGVTFGGTWGTTADWSGTTANRLISSSIKPAEVVTLVTTTNSDLALRTLTDGTLAEVGTVSGLKGSAINATRITFGNTHNNGNNTMSYRILSVAVFRGADATAEEMATAVASPTSDAISRTLESTDETWSTADQWTSGKPETDDDVVLTVTADGGSTLNLDETVSLASLVVKGSQGLAVTGEKLTVTGITSLYTDTDISEIETSLGAISGTAGKTLTVGPGTAIPTSISNVTLGFLGTEENPLQYASDDSSAASWAKLCATRGGTYTFSGYVNVEGFSDSEVAEAQKDWLRFRATQTINIVDGAYVTATRMVSSDNGGANVTINQTGGTLKLSGTDTSCTSTGGNAVLLGHWGATTTYNLSVGQLLAEDGALQLGWDGPAHLTVGQDSGETTALVSVKRLSGANRNNSASVTIKPTGTLQIGSAGLDMQTNKSFTLAGGTLAVADNATIAIQHTDGLNVTVASKISAPTGKTATINSTLKGSAALTLADGGTIDLSNAGTAYTGDISVEAGTTVVLTSNQLATLKLSVPEGAALKIKATMNELLAGKISADIAADSSIVVTPTVDGKDATVSIEDSKLSATFTADATMTGSAWWWDYEFNGNGNNIGSEGTGLSWDGDRPLKDGEEYTEAVEGNQMLKLPARPWRNVSSWPAEATFVMYAKAGATANGVLVSFGSKNGVSKTITLMTGDNPQNGDMRLVYTDSNTVEDLVHNFSVPNATTSYHLYAFVLDKVDGNTRVTVYTDGERSATKTFDTSITLGGGFQIASVHGGCPTGLNRLADNDAATMDFLRVANIVLTDDALKSLAAAYPYTSPTGRATRTLDGTDANWVEAEGSTVWSQDTLNEDATTTTTAQNAPNNGTNVVLNATAATKVTVNLPETATAYETLTVTGDVTFVAGEGTKPLAVSGRTTVNGNVEVSYDLASFGQVTVKAGKTLTIDASSIDLSTIYANQAIGLTGAATLEEDAKIDVKLPTEVAGRKAEVTTTEIGGYDLTITVDGELNAHVPAAGATWETLTWRLGETEIDKPADLTGLAVPLTAAEGATLTLTEDVVAGSYTLVDNLTVSGAMLNGLTLGPGVVLTTDVGSFTMGSVKAATSVTKDTRPTVVLTAGTVSLSGAQTGTATAWHNINLTIAEGTVCNYPANRNDWTGSTITVNGTFNAASAQIWYGVSYGSLADADTKLIVSGTATVGEMLIGPWGNTTNNAIEVTGTGSLTITTLTLHAATTVAVSVAETASLTVNGTAKGDSWAQAIANVTINGTAKWVDTITGTLTLADGATLDVGTGLTVVGAIDQQGDLAIKTTAEGGATILTGGEGSTFDAETITIADRTGVAAEVDDVTVKLIVTAVAQIGGTQYTTLDEALEAAEAGDTIVLLAAAGDIRLPAGVNLNTNGNAVGTVTDQYGNVLEATDGTYTYPTYTVEVTSGDTTKGYTSLQAAYDNAATGATIKLLGDTEAPGIKIKKSITLDLNNCTLTLTPPPVGSTGTETLGMQILKTTESITIKDGTIDVCAENLAAEKPIKMLIQNYSLKLTLSNVTLDGTNLVKPTNMPIYVLSNNQGTVELSGSTSITAPEGSVAFDVCKYASYTPPTVTLDTTGTITGDVEVSGGAFILAEGSNKPTGDVILSAGSVTGVVPTAAEGKVLVEEDGVYTVVDAAVEVNGVAYATLQEAYEAAATGATITLLGDTEAPGIKIKKSITLDLNNCTLTLTPPPVGSTGTETLGMQILKTTESITIKDGTIDVCAENLAAEKPIKMLIQNYSLKLTLSNVTLDGTNLVKPTSSPIYVLSNNQGDVTIGAGTTITAPTGAIAFDSCKYASYDAPTVTVEAGAVIDGKVEVDGGTLNNKSETALDVTIVSGGTVIGSVDVDETSYEIKVGDVYCTAIVCDEDVEPEVAKAAAELFTDITKTYVDEAGDTVADIDWDFGISAIERSGENLDQVTITAKVQGEAGTAAGYAAGTTVTIYADGTAIGTATTAKDGTAKLSGVAVSAITGKKLTVKAANE